jgi:hypothetical protein
VAVPVLEYVDDPRSVQDPVQHLPPVPCLTLQASVNLDKRMIEREVTNLKPLRGLVYCSACSTAYKCMTQSYQCLSSLVRKLASLIAASSSSDWIRISPSLSGRLQIDLLVLEYSWARLY